MDSIQQDFDLDGFGGVEGGAVEPWVGPWGPGSPGGDVDLHAANASTAAYHAEVAAKHAASLAQWVQYLSGTLGHLQNRVTELEDWKRGALEETRRLREEHRALKDLVLREETAGGLPSGSGGGENGSGSEEAPPAPPPPPPPGLAAAVPTEEEERAPFSPLAASPGGSPQRLVSASSSSAFSMTSVPSASSFADMDTVGKEEGVQVASTFLDGALCDRAVWRIGHLSAKLRGCMGRALVSTPFRAAGLEDVRLMISPDGKDQAQGKNRRQKELYARRITEGPLDASLKLKIPSCPGACVLQYYLTVGSERRGPFTHNFAESTVSECGDFGDWLKQLDSDRSLTVALDAFPLVEIATGDGGAGHEMAGGSLEPAVVYPSFRDVGPLQ